MALNILKELAFPEKESIDTYHKQWEAMKIAFADGKYHVTDPRYMKVSPADLLAPEYGAHRAAQITDTAAEPCPELPPKSGTVYFCTADGEGNMVSFIQSNYTGFGAGVLRWRAPASPCRTAGADFSLDPEDSDNCSGAAGSGPTTPLSPASCSRTAKRWAPSA